MTRLTKVSPCRYWDSVSEDIKFYVKFSLEEIYLHLDSDSSFPLKIVTAALQLFISMFRAIYFENCNGESHAEKRFQSAQKTE